MVSLGCAQKQLGPGQVLWRSPRSLVLTAALALPLPASMGPRPLKDLGPPTHPAGKAALTGALAGG